MKSIAVLLIYLLFIVSLLGVIVAGYAAIGWLVAAVWNLIAPTYGLQELIWWHVSLVLFTVRVVVQIAKA